MTLRTHPFRTFYPPVDDLLNKFYISAPSAK